MTMFPKCCTVLLRWSQLPRYVMSKTKLEIYTKKQDYTGWMSIYSKVFEWRITLTSSVLVILSSRKRKLLCTPYWWKPHHHFWSEPKLLQHLLLPRKWLWRERGGDSSSWQAAWGFVSTWLRRVWAVKAMWNFKWGPPNVMQWTLWGQRSQWQQGLSGITGNGVWVACMFCNKCQPTVIELSSCLTTLIF